MLIFLYFVYIHEENVEIKTFEIHNYAIVDTIFPKNIVYKYFKLY